MQLTEKAFVAIRSNGELYGKIADHLGIMPTTMPDKIRNNLRGTNSDFTQIGVINLIKQYTLLTDSEILTEESTTIK